MIKNDGVKIKIISFGYKYGMVENANFVQDVRFLPNPYYDENLKSKSGMDKDVREYVKKTPESKDYIARLKSFLEVYISNALLSEKEDITVAIGCTGGRHRSVTVAWEIYSHLVSLGYSASVSHRDIEKG